MHANAARFIVLAALVTATGIVLLVSLRGNFLYGYSLGQTDEKRLLFAWANVGADLWKAFGLIAVSLLWRSSQRRTAIGALLTWLMCLVFGINSALGIYVHDRATLVGGKETLHASLRDAQAELSELESKLRARGVQRATSEIDADIAAILARPVTVEGRVRGTVDTLSQDCSISIAGTREPCREVLRLRQERASAAEREALDARASNLRMQIAAFRNRGAELSPDPVAEFYIWLSRGFVQARDVGFGFPLFFALLIEVVSAFGPVTIAAYAAASSAEARSGVPRPAAAGQSAPRPAMASLRAPEPDILLWMAERAAPASGNQAISLDELHADYVHWRADPSPMTTLEFERELDHARALPDLAGKIRKFKDRYYGIGLVRKKAISAG